jgi:hypothetical protein
MRCNATKNQCRSALRKKMYLAVTNWWIMSSISCEQSSQCISAILI